MVDTETGIRQIAVSPRKVPIVGTAIEDSLYSMTCVVCMLLPYIESYSLGLRFLNTARPTIEHIQGTPLRRI